MQLSAVNSINWARVVAQIVYYVAAARGARRARPARSPSPCRPAISATSSPAMSRAQMGLPIDAAGRRHQPQRHPRPLLRDRRMDDRAACEPSLSAQHGHPGRQQLRAPAVRAVRPRRQRWRRRDDGSSARPAASPRPRQAGAASQGLFRAAALGRSRRPCARCGELHRATGELVDPHTAVGVARRPRPAAATRETPIVALATAHPGQVPRRGREAPPASARRCRRVLADLHRAAGADRRAAERRSSAVQDLRPSHRRNDRNGRHENLRRTMSASPRSPTASASRPTAWTVETASLGVWVDVGTATSRPRINGVAHLLEHMAFKGTRAAQRPRHRRGDRGGRRPSSTPTPRASRPPITPRCWRTTCRWRSTSSPTSCSTRPSTPTSWSASAPSILQEIGQAKDTPDDIIFDHFQEHRLPGPGDGPPGPRPRRDHRASCRARRSSATCASPTAPAQHGAGGRRQARARPRWWRLADKLFGAICRAARPCPPPSPRAMPAASGRRGPRPRAGASRARLPRRPATTIPTTTPPRCCRPRSAAACPRACSRRCARSAACLLDPLLRQLATRDGGMFGIYAGTGEKEVAELVPVLCDELAEAARRPDRAGSEARRGADEGRPPDVAAKAPSARCEQLAQPAADLRPADSAGGGGGAHRCRHDRRPHAPARGVSRNRRRRWPPSARSAR